MRKKTINYIKSIGIRQFSYKNPYSIVFLKNNYMCMNMELENKSYQIQYGRVELHYKLRIFIPFVLVFEKQHSAFSNVQEN